MIYHFNIGSKTSRIGTVNLNNILKAIKDMNYEHSNCMSHILNLIVQKALKKIK